MCRAAITTDIPFAHPNIKIVELKKYLSEHGFKNLKHIFPGSNHCLKEAHVQLNKGFLCYILTPFPKKGFKI